MTQPGKATTSLPAHRAPWLPKLGALACVAALLVILGACGDGSDSCTLSDTLGYTITVTGQTGGTECSGFIPNQWPIVYPALNGQPSEDTCNMTKSGGSCQATCSPGPETGDAPTITTTYTVDSGGFSGSGSFEVGISPCSFTFTAKSN